MDCGAKLVGIFTDVTFSVLSSSLVLELKNRHVENHIIWGFFSLDLTSFCSNVCQHLVLNLPFCKENSPTSTCVKKMI